MNDFLEQFLIESRELVTQLADDLAALERASQDRERLDRVFRAFHTLKGAAGIVDFHPMGQLMHLVEDALAEARSTGQPVSAALIGNCIGSLDLLEQWLAEIEATEALPPLAETQIGRLRAAFGGEKVDASPVMAGGAMNASSWLDVLRASMPAPAEARTVLRYAPDPASFFQGRDPLGLIVGLPGLCGLSIQARQAWPELDALDPFNCNIIVCAYSSATMAQLAGYTALPAAEVEIVDLASRDPHQAELPIEAASRILAAQVKLLTAIGPQEAWAGRLTSAGLVASNVLRYMRHDDSARLMQDAVDQSVAAKQADDLIRALRVAIEQLNTPAPVAETTDPVNRQPHAETTNALRVDVRRIDAIVKLTSELTVVKNAVGHVGELLAGGSSRESVAKALREQQSNLARLINELQRSVLAIRVLPLRTVFRRFPRLVKEIAATVGKEIDLVTAGDDTEADKLVVESLFEPLLHVLRNAVDHGIETREQRLAAGKPQTAILRLNGYRDGDYVIVDVADDGRGIDTEAIATAALGRALVTQEALATMTREEILDIVFLPGFSTAEKVTDLSGRGVGMDAVRSAVEQFGGRVSIQTEVAVGTTVRFTLPFSVMMTRVMTIEAGGQMFGLPFESVIEMLHIPRGDILPVGATQAIVFRGQTIPFVSLPMTLGGSKGDMSADPAKVVIAQLGGHLGALEVERFGERMDLMLTPRTGLLSGVMGIAGTTLLGDGRVLIVLELQELLQ